MAEKKRETTKAESKAGTTRGGRKSAPSEEKSANPTSKAAAGTQRGGRAASGAGSKAKKAAAGNGESQPPKTGRGAARGGAGKSPDLRKDLREFASGRPAGWGHDDWLNFLESLRSRGHNVNDRDAIGLALEKERLDIALGGVKGVGPQRRKSLVERYGNVWNLRNADPEEVAGAAGIKPDLAQKIQSELS